MLGIDVDVRSVPRTQTQKHEHTRKHTCARTQTRTRTCTLECCLCEIVAECSGMGVAVKEKKFESRQEHVGERCLLITESPKTPGHYRYLIWVLEHVSRHWRHPTTAPLVTTPRGLFLV